MSGQEVAVMSKRPQEVIVFIDGLFGGGVAGSTRKALAQKFEAARFVTLHCGAVSSGEECFCVVGNLISSNEPIVLDSEGPCGGMLLSAQGRSSRLRRKQLHASGSSGLG